MLVEICCDGLDAARAARAAGADRIELCSDLSCGGITPSHEELDQMGGFGIPVHVLIRPRGGNFVYDYNEIHHILFNIAYCGNAGISGVVLGALDSRNHVDKMLCQDFVDIAHSYNLSVTFHRAIDEAESPLDALETILSLGVERVLTSGGAYSAPQGAQVIKKMVEMAKGTGTIILPGGGITPDNALQLIRDTGVEEIHGSRKELTGIKRLI